MTTSSKPITGTKARRTGVTRAILFFAAIAIALALIIGWRLSSTSTAASSLLSTRVSRANIEQTVLATGVLEPIRLVSVGAQVSGQVETLSVAIGDKVSAGDPIAEIDAITQTNSVKTSELALKSYKAQLAAAKAQLVEAELSYNRSKVMIEAEAMSEADFQTNKASYESARADVEALQAQIASAEVELSTATANLGYTRIVAPMDGVVVAIVVEEGQTVNANQSAPTIVKLAKLDQMTVSAEISEADIDKVEPGQTVYFTTLGNSTERHYATLRTIEPTPRDIEELDSIQASDATAIYYNALFDVDNSSGALRTWMTVQVYVQLASAEDVLVIPVTALGDARPDGAQSVQVVSEDGQAELRWVMTGIDDGINVEVLSGLREGERVVVANGSGSTSNTAADSGRRGPPGGGMMMGPPPGRG